MFELPDADMELVRQSYRKQKNVVLYFSPPKDDTPGCTMEALDFSLNSSLAGLALYRSAGRQHGRLLKPRIFSR